MVSATSAQLSEPPSYTDDDRQRLFEAFQAGLALHRKRLHKLYLWIAGVVVAFAAIVALQHTLVVWFAALAFIAIAVGCWRQLLETIDGTFCPGCGERQFASLGQFCPQCGSTDIAPKSLLLAPECRSCRAILAFGKCIPVIPRRFCSCCGLKLDESGF